MAIAAAIPTAARPDADRITGTSHGADTFVIPYGPIRSGVFEAIQFMIETGGEDVLALETRPAFKHRGARAAIRGDSTSSMASTLAERVAGIASVAHAHRLRQAVERALERRRARGAPSCWRTIHAELERIANHLDVAAKLAEDAALCVGQARMQILKEDVLRLRGDLCGSRFGRGRDRSRRHSAESPITRDELAERSSASNASFAAIAACCSRRRRSPIA